MALEAGNRKIVVEVLVGEFHGGSIMPERLKTFGALMRERRDSLLAPLPERRESPSARGYDRRWQKVRRMALARDNWLCQTHKRESGLLVEATDVDHIVVPSAGLMR